MTLDATKPIPFWIGGKEHDTVESFPVTSPLDQSTLYNCCTPSSEDIEQIAKAAQKGYQEWSRISPTSRRDFFLRAAEVITRRKDELATHSHAETGMAKAGAERDVLGAAEYLKSTAGSVGTVRGAVPSLESAQQSAMILKVPYGVVLCIVPWNAPFSLTMRAICGPLAMGNSVILKGSERCPACFWAVASALHEAGMPPGTLNTVIHRPEAAEKVTSALIAQPEIRKISFTGSSSVGAAIASTAGRFLKPCVLELGGKAPSIICEDADIEAAATKVAMGAFLNAGQICMSTERVIVHKSVAEAFKGAIKAVTEKSFGNNGLQLISQQAVQKTKALVQDALSKGAQPLQGSIQAEAQSPTTMSPVIVEGVTSDMDLHETESFGPSLSLYTVNSDDEAIQLANDTPYGLVASIFTADLRRAMRMAHVLEFGGIQVNGMTVHSDAALPQGGFKQSGFGRLKGPEGLDEWVLTKTLLWDN